MENFKAAVAFKFGSSITNLNKYRRENPLQLVQAIEEVKEQLWFTIKDEEGERGISFPIPYKDAYGNLVIGTRVTRAVGSWHHEGKEYSYWELMLWLFTGKIESAFPHAGKRAQIDRLIQSFVNSDPMAFRSFQEMVNNIVNRLPLTGTPMETWAMCNRVVFLDPEFEGLSPQAALLYQKEANIKFFPWTSVGLSDSGMCNNNLLKVDLRQYTPFGLSHHNPKRNLHQTLGMKGDEAPLIRTKSSAALTKLGVDRRGWNLMTCFLDTPLTFEDQLIVDNRHLDKFTLENRRFICFGDVLVSAGDELEEGAILAVEPNGQPLRFWNKTDRTLVIDVVKETIPFNAKQQEVTVVYVETKHKFKEGIKLTNCHGNKGVVSFANCGSMFDEGRGIDVPIDIIVSAQTIGRRQNYGQILEALLTLTGGKDKKIVIPDDSKITSSQISNFLESKGYNKDGTSPVATQWFNGRAICGWGFWGLIKNPENQAWSKEDVTATDGRGLRKAGIKLSHIELKGLTTIFGPQNPVVHEILSHQQGFEDVCELVEVLEVLRGKPMLRPAMNWSAIKPLIQTRGYFHSKNELGGTIIDESMFTDGFMLELPRMYHVFTPENTQEDSQYNLVAADVTDLASIAIAGGKNVFINKIFVPSCKLRASWQHPTGMWGLSDLGGYLNNIILACHQLQDSERGEENLLRAVRNYFSSTARRLSTKTGEISTYALAVRYPHSAKATATLANEDLPSNWLEIHQEMATDLGVSTGDYLIAERFPCLGFKSLRIQRVIVTDDPQCRFVIRVSGNSLVSQNLDFDGDVLFLISFHTKAAKEALAEEFLNPSVKRIGYINEANAVKKPGTQALSLEEVNIKVFPPLTAEAQAEIVGGLTGLKRGTGAVVALAYNMMRIIEGTVGYDDQDTNLAMEVIMDKVANSVFSQKHGEISLEARCKRAICTADLEDMYSMGFPKEGSQKLCEIITKEATAIGVTDLKAHYKKHLEKGHSNVVNLIVKKNRPFYFATRSNLEPVRLLEHLDSKPVDLTSHLWARAKKMQENKFGDL